VRPLEHALPLVAMAVPELLQLGRELCRAILDGEEEHGAPRYGDRSYDLPDACRTG
jgi:hypothetical protein